MQDLLDRAAPPRGRHRRDRAGLLRHGRPQGRAQRGRPGVAARERFAPTSVPRAPGQAPVIHTRSASDDTLRILREEGEDGSGCQRGRRVPLLHRNRLRGARSTGPGLLHFVLGHHHLRNAQDLRDVAPLFPWIACSSKPTAPLAPVPYRGKTNSPAYVPEVARQIATVRGMAGDRGRGHGPQLREPVQGAWCSHERVDLGAPQPAWLWPVRPARRCRPVPTKTSLLPWCAMTLAPSMRCCNVASIPTRAIPRAGRSDARPAERFVQGVRCLLQARGLQVDKPATRRTRAL